MDSQGPGQGFLLDFHVGATQIWLLIAYLLMILGSAYFSAAENSLAAVNKIRLRNLAGEGNRRAKLTLALSERFDQVLTTILIGVNILQIGGASVATQLVFSMFGSSVEKQAVATAVATVVTTLIVFFFADLIPKSYAVAHADRFAMQIAPSLKVLTVLLYPVSIIFRGVNALTAKLFRVKEEPTVTEEELSTIIDAVEEEGVIDAEQGDLLQSALEFAETTVADVLTLREDVVGIDLHADHDSVMKIIRDHKYSRFPVWDGDIDHIVGVLQIRNYLKAYLKQEELSLGQLCAPPFYTTLDAGIDRLLEQMSRAKVTMAIVRDPDSGRVRGIVTVEDFLEELVGEIFDEDDVVNNRFMKLGGNYFRVGAACTMGEMFRDMGYRGKVNVSRVKTVGAWVTEQLGHAPEPDDTFVWRDLTVTVTETEEGRLRFAEVKLAHPILDAVTARASDKEEESGK